MFDIYIFFEYIKNMSPTIFKYKDYRVFFFSREETKIHVHVTCSEGEAKFWIIPNVKLAKNYGLKDYQINEIKKIIKEKKDVIIDNWKKHFRS